MKTSDFYFDLPAHLIAQHPSEERGQSRLMVLDRLTGKRQHCMVEGLPEILCGHKFIGESGRPPLLVFNNSKVRKARLFGTSLETGAKVEFLLLGTGDWGLGTGDRGMGYGVWGMGTCWQVLVKRAKRHKPGSRYAFFDSDGKEIARAEILAPQTVEFLQSKNSLAVLGLAQNCSKPQTPNPKPQSPVPSPQSLLCFDRPIDDEWLDRHGHIPLPPYIKRQDGPSDSRRYQTVYAKAYGSAASPTAGLHFTSAMLGRLEALGIETAFITLHIGLGTFLPVRCDDITGHVMHEESFSIDEEAAEKIDGAKKAGRKIVAVGTTSVRALESAWRDGKLERGGGRTNIFIYPGFSFNVVDSIFTNFHTPESTLLMLVSAFAGRDLILESYAEAVKEGYRFFSYGDAMLLT